MNTKFPAVASLDARPPRERSGAENLPRNSRIGAENAPTGRNKRNPMRAAQRALGERLARAESFLPQMSRMNTDESPDGAELPSVGCQPYGNGNENDARCKCAIAGTRGRGKSPADFAD